MSTRRRPGLLVWAIVMPLAFSWQVAVASDLVGRRVIVAKKGPLTIRDGMKVIGQANELEYIVSRQEGAVVELSGHPGGWVQKDELIPAEEGVDYFSKRINNDPTFAGWYLKRAIATECQGKLDDALRDCDEAIRLDSGLAAAYYNRGKLWNRKKNPVNAMADFNQVIRLDPKHTSAFFDRGNVWYRQKDYDRAIADYSEAEKLKPNSPRIVFNLGVAWSSKRNEEKAITYLTKAIELDPKYAPAYANRALEWMGKEDLIRAIADYSEAIRLDRSVSLWYANRGMLYRFTGNYKKAVADCDQAIRLGHRDASTYHTRAESHDALGNYAEALSDFTESIRKEPVQYDYYSNLAWLLATCPDKKYRDGKKAVEYAKKACGLTGYKDVVTLDGYAAALAEAGNFAEAEKWQSEVVRLAKDRKLEYGLRLGMYRLGKPYHRSKPITSKRSD